MSRVEVSTPKVSIILAAHGDCPWIESAINTVLSQSFTHWELICVLDEVNESVHAAVDSFGMDLRVRTLAFQSNIGASAARNEGLYVARGELIAVLDSDDEWTPEHLRIAVDFMDTHRGVMLVGSSYISINEYGVATGNVVRAPRFLVKQSLAFKNCFAHSSVVYRRDLALELGGYPIGVTVGEDYCLWLRIARYGKVRNLKGVSVKYRIHEGQSSRKPITKNCSGEILKYKLALATQVYIPKWLVHYSHKSWSRRRYSKM